MYALPAPKTRDIMQRINTLQAAAVRFIDSGVISDSSRELRAIRREIEGLFKADARAAWEALGAWYQLAGDCEGMEDAFRKSLALGDSGSNHINLVVNRLNLGMFSAAQEACAELQNLAPDHIEAAHLAAFRCGALKNAAQFAERAKAMQIKWDDSSAAKLTIAIQMLKNAGVSEAQISSHLDLAGEVLRRHHIRPQVDARVTAADGFFNGVTYALPVPVSAEEAFDMNLELAMAEDEAGIKKHLAFDVVFEANA